MCVNFNTLSKNNEIHIWETQVDILLHKIEYVKNLLLKEELLQSQNFRFEKDRNQFILSRGILRYLGGRYLNINPREIKFNLGKYGKPSFNLNKNIKFNISHSEGYIVLAFTNNIDIGIDVEYIKSNFDVLEIVENYFSEKEIEALLRLPHSEHTEAFYRGWTRKEAFIKAKGKGLSFPLNSFSVSIASDTHAELYETQWDKTEKNSWQIIPFKTTPNYKAAIALKGNPTSINYYKFKI